MLYISKEAINALIARKVLVSVKYRHPGPTGNSCKGGEVRLGINDQPKFNKGESVLVFCAGCGYYDTVSSRKS